MSTGRDTGGATSRSSPAEVRIAAGLFAGAGLAFVALALVMVFGAGASQRTLLLPVTSAVFGGLVAGGLLLRMPSSRWAGYVVAVLFALLHAFAMLSAELWWVRVFSGLAAAAYVFGAVLLSSAPLLRYVTGTR